MKTPTNAEVTDALKKGLGRAYLWSKKGKLSAGCLQQACLTDYRFDRQVEDVRGTWLWQLILAASVTEQLKGAIYEALQTIEESDAEAQLCQLARYYASSGDNRFVEQLRRIVIEKPVKDGEWLGEEELIFLTGKDGFLAAVRRHGEDLVSRDWEWFDGALADTAVEQLGEGGVIQTLRTAANRDVRIQRFLEAWMTDREKKSSTTKTAYREQLANYTAKDVIQAAEHPGRDYFSFRGWGRYATDADAAIVYERMLETTDIDKLRRYLQVFARRPWPRFDERMLQLCLHQDENIRQRAASAASNNEHEELRAFALKHLSDPEHQEDAVEMLSANYEDGDESRVLDVLSLPDNECHLHWTLMSVRKLVENNPNARCEEAVTLVYEHTPCSACRYSMVKLQSERVGLSDNLLEECRYDVEVDTRELAGGPTWKD